MYEKWRSVAIVKSIIYILFLVIMSVQDIKKKSVTLKSIVLMTITILILSVFGINDGKLVILTNSEIFNAENIMGTAAVTIILTIYSAVTGCLGCGDVIILCISCAFMGWFYTLQVFVLALITMFTVVLAGIILKKISYRQQIPFIPYLLIGELGVLLFA